MAIGKIRFGRQPHTAAGREGLMRARADEGPQRIRIALRDGKIEAACAVLGKAGLEQVRVLQADRGRDGDAIGEQMRARLQRRIRFMAVMAR